MRLLTILFLTLVGCILTNSRLSLSYAAMGLELWFQKMIPTLLPFMILSGIMVRLKLTDKFALVLYPIVRPLYRVRRNVCYAMIMGFLCGFPMGARVVDDLYIRSMITRREAEYLLAFCNNIGPVYFCSFVLPLLGRKLVLPYLFGMYGVPLLYGLVLRFTLYKDLPVPGKKPSGAELVACETSRKVSGTDLVSCETYRKVSGTDLVSCGPSQKISRPPSALANLLAQTDSSVRSSMQNILTLGGYMVLFNLLNLLPHIVLGRPLAVLAPLLEITGGLSMLGTAAPLYSLLALSFGGLSCIAQTYSSIGDSDLSIGNYVQHKMMLTALNALFYLGWFLLQPSSFLL